MDEGSMFGKRSHLLKLLHINIQLTAQFVLCLGKGRYLTGQLMRLVQFCILLLAESFLLGEMELDFKLLAAEERVELDFAHFVLFDKGFELFSETRQSVSQGKNQVKVRAGHGGRTAYLPPSRRWVDPEVCDRL